MLLFIYDGDNGMLLADSLKIFKYEMCIVKLLQLTASLKMPTAVLHLPTGLMPSNNGIRLLLTFRRALWKFLLNRRLTFAIAALTRRRSHILQKDTITYSNKM